MKRKLFSASVCLFFLFQIALAAVPLARCFTWEDFEGPDTSWSTNKFGGSLLSGGQISTDFASSGKSSFRGHFTFPAKGGRAAFTTLQVGDVTGLKSITFDLYNSSPLAFEGFLVYKSGSDWKWHESNKFKIQSGWNKDVAIAVNGAGPTTIQGEFLENVEELDLVFDAQEAGDGYLYLDNIRLDGPDAAAFAAKAAESAVKGQEILLAGFEGLNSLFTADSWSGSSSTGVDLVKVKTTEGTHAGRFLFDSKVPDDKPSYTLEADMDLTDAVGLKLDVYNPLPDEADMAIAISTGQWLYHESSMRTLKPGWNLDVSFAIHAKTFKSQASNWSNTVGVDNLAHTRKVSLLFMPHVVGPGYFLVDRVRFVTDDAKKFAAELKTDGAMESPAPQGTDRLLEGFEGDNGWFADSGASAAVTASVVTAKTTQGTRLLECTYDIEGTKKNAFFGFEDRLDLAGAEALKVDIYNPQQEPLQAEMALIIGDQFQWFESRLTNLKPGWNIDVTFPLDTPSFKCEASHWQNKVLPGPLSKVRKLLIGVYSNSPQSGKVYFDNVRITAPEGAQEGNLHPRVRPIGSSMDVYSLKTLKAQAAAPAKKAKTPLRPITGREVIFDPLLSAAGGWQADQKAADDSYGEAVHYEKKDGVSGVMLKYDTGTDSQKAAFYKDGLFDWTSVEGFRIDLYNPQDHPLEISLALKVDPNFDWYESVRITVKPGWNHDLTFAVDAPTWKSLQSNWANTSELMYSDDVREINLLVYPNRGEQGEVFLSHVRTVERDVIGAMGSKGLGKYLGISSKTTLSATNEKAALVNGFETQPTLPNQSTGLYTTQGKKSWQINFISYSTNQQEFIVKMPPAYQDLRPYEALQFDIYNPGPPRSLALGFANDNGSFIKTATSLTLQTGWNRNLTVMLDGPLFESTDTSWNIGDTLTDRADVTEIHFQYTGPPGRGSMNIDNLRVVGKGLPSDTSADGSESLLLKFNPSEAVQLQLGGNLWKTDKSGAGAEFSQAQLDLRGLGQEFRASAGTVLPTTDDPLGLLDGSKLGTGVMGLVDKAKVGDASVELLGFARGGSVPLSLGSDSGYLARVTQTFFGDYTVGAGLLDSRFGAKPGSNPLTAEVESDIKTFDADFKGYVPKLSLTFEGEVARSAYDEYLGMSYGSPSPLNNAFHFAATWSHGPLKLQAGRTEKDQGFFSPYATDTNNGYFQDNGEVDYQLDTLPLIRDIHKRGGFLGDFVENLKTYTQYYDWHVTTTSYKNFGIRTVLETNNYKTPLYVKAWWYWYNGGKNAGDTSLDNPGEGTHLLELTQDLEVRYRLLSNFYLNALGRLDSTKYWQATTGQGGFLWYFTRDFTFNTDYKFTKMVGNTYGLNTRSGQYNNICIGLTDRIRTRLMEYDVSLTYGTPSFTGYWNDLETLRTLDSCNLTLTGRF